MKDKNLEDLLKWLDQSMKKIEEIKKQIDNQIRLPEEWL